MSRSIANVQTSTDTFGSWIAKTNEVATTFAETVTVKANTAGDLTTGNGFVVGIFGANTLTATTIRGGSVATSTNVSIMSNTFIGNTSSQTITMHNGIGQVKTTSYTTTNTNAQIVDSFPTTEFRTSKYLISIHNTNNNDYQSTEIMLLQNGTTALVTEYATLVSTATLGQFDANVASGTVRLFVTPTLANNVIKYQRTSMAV
jgi:hypothetical protein